MTIVVIIQLSVLMFENCCMSLGAKCFIRLMICFVACHLALRDRYSASVVPLPGQLVALPYLSGLKEAGRLDETTVFQVNNIQSLDLA